ncbi:phosphate ABC transporter, substrate-binding family protein [Mycoplasmopsis alligatoris A21JP2]|uniref:Phosphate ABC transporter, substrate-binding family protein n=1 Tax=Mycoplasmopsis alligatoris A21JP2 TaxID=747682 RepID=D4XV40_9BACT|nr:phosphate ABC transporter, substrate-binding family protein [Mycoplasmopsis alligatoris A21JP2]
MALFSTTWINIKVVSAAGSSGVQPFFSSLSNIYSKTNKLEIGVVAGGSGHGINAVANGKINIGMSSKSPKHTVETSKDLMKNWKEKQLKTVTIGNEGIAIVAKLPKDTKFTVSKENIGNLYKAFAGHEKVYLSEFNAQKKYSEIHLKPFARDGAANTSGTAEAFYLSSGFKGIKNDDLTNQTLLGKKNYGIHTKTTSESNSEAYGIFNKDGQAEGSIIYLSLGFVLSNKERIEKDGFSVFYYQNDKDTIEATFDNVKNKTYAWYRPFNLILSTNESQSTKELIEWVLFNQDSEIEKIYQDFGIVKLDKDALSSMYKPNTLKEDFNLDDLKANLNNFWIDDISLKKYGVE